MSALSVVPDPIAPELATEAESWPDQARALTIVDDATNARAGEMLKGIKALAGQIDGTFDPIKKKAHDTHRAICDEQAKAKKPLLEAEKILKDSMTAYYDEQQRLARAEAARLEAEAREIEEAARLEEAAALEAAGQNEEAERVLVEEPPTPAFVPPVAVAKVAGVAMREEWSGEVTNLRDLCRAIGEGKAPVTLVTINQATLNGLARSLKGELKYPGIRAVKRTGVAARAR